MTVPNRNLLVSECVINKRKNRTSHEAAQWRPTDSNTIYLKTKTKSKQSISIVRIINVEIQNRPIISQEREIILPSDFSMPSER